MYKNHLENIDSKKLLFVNTFTSTLLIASIAFIFYHFIFHGYYLDSAWPKNSFFQKPEIIGNDFSRMVDVSSSLDPYSNMRRVFLNEANPYRKVFSKRNITDFRSILIRNGHAHIMGFSKVVV